MSDPPEPRFVADLAVRVFGMDAVGRPFSRNAHTLDISDRGARLSGLEAKLLVGDVIGVQLGDSKARCRVIWVTPSGNVDGARIAVTQRASASCPRQPPMWTESVRSLPLAASTSGLLPRRGAYWNSQQPSSGGGRVALE